MTTIPNLTDYGSARRTLLAEADERGAVLSSYIHPLDGPDGSTLATDVARFGAPPGSADRVVLVASGVHGVEGHAGNGLQRLLVESGRLQSLPPGLAVVLIHAVNPYGFAWSRRVDHDNIDVNRNFVDYEHLPTNPLYHEVDPILNPTSADLDLHDHDFLVEIKEFWDRVGELTMIRTLNGGQYSYPQGVQYGGSHTSWSRQTLQTIWTEQLAGAECAVTLDIHTGLGPSGRLTAFQTADDTETTAEMGKAWFPEHLYRVPRTTDDTIDHGLLGPAFDAWASGRLETATFVLEFGTVDPAQALIAFRADNWLHHHGDTASPKGAAIAQLMRDQFFIEDTGWRAQVADQGCAAIHATLDGFA